MPVFVDPGIRQGEWGGTALARFTSPTSFWVPSRSFHLTAVLSTYYFTLGLEGLSLSDNNILPLA
jgi:hypothetical protein